jgi:hypothetical protein
LIELEAVASGDSDPAREHELIAELRGAFTISDDRLCATGYADQLRQFTLQSRSVVVHTLQLAQGPTLANVAA